MELNGSASIIKLNFFRFGELNWKSCIAQNMAICIIIKLYKRIIWETLFFILHWHVYNKQIIPCTQITGNLHFRSFHIKIHLFNRKVSWKWKKTMKMYLLEFSPPISDCCHKLTTDNLFDLKRREYNISRFYKNRFNLKRSILNKKQFK